MSLASGDKLGPYEVLASLGAGGMGEVYRARDTRLDRTVAIKVLPAHVATDPVLKQRFAREARTLAALVHPHICPIFDVGIQDGTDFIVMECLEGETLAERLARGALPLDQALRHAVEIADALDKAHRQGVVHRDLKPANIMLTRTGAKLLDFGLATLRTELPLTAVSEAATAGSPLTRQGDLLGTVVYMSPEQLEGREADARTDIFAFGVLVYEMVTGHRAFDGRTQVSTIAAILEREPAPLASFQPMSPATLDRLIAGCLAKDPDNRWQSAGDLARQLSWLAGEGSQADSAVSVAVTDRRPGWRRAVPLAAAAAAGAVITGIAAWLLYSPIDPAPRAVARFDYEVPESHQFRNAERSILAFSPDGGQFVYNTTHGLYLRSLREPEARLIPGTEENLSNPFFSPDGQWVGYFSGGQLKKIAAAGGTPIPLCKAENPLGAHWGSDGLIVYGQAEGIKRVSANGGTPDLLVPAAEGESVYGPQVLPGGKWVLLTVTRVSGSGAWDAAQVVIHSLDSGQRKVLVSGGSDAKYVPTGHLVYAAGEVLYALPFDLNTLEVSGGPVPIVTGVQRPPRSFVNTGSASYGFSDLGTLVYVQGEEVTRDRVIALVGRNGEMERLAIPPGPYVNPRVSPDGTRVAVQTLEDDGRGDLWVYDLSGKSQIRQLTSGGISWYPIWTPDGRRLTFVSQREGERGIYWQPADGSAVAERLTPGDRPDSWSVRGPTLAFRHAQQGKGDAGIWTFVPGSAQPTRVHDVPGSSQYEAAFSPDGNWIAYTSTETGRDEIYVQRFPAAGPPVRLTQNGGTFPLWAPDGREIFYRHSFDRQLNRTQGTRLFGLSVNTSGGVEFGAEQTLPMEGFFVFNTYKDYDITPDGKRFLMIFPANRRTRLPRIHIVQNWFDDLKQRVPVS